MVISFFHGMDIFFSQVCTKQRLYNDVNFTEDFIDWAISMYCIFSKNKHQKLCRNDASKFNKFIYNKYNIAANIKNYPSPKNYIKTIVKELCDIALWTLKKDCFNPHKCDRPSA